MNSTTEIFDEVPKIVIFGGSGFIGTHLIRALNTKGDVRIVSVDINPPNEKFDNVEYLVADVRNLGSLKIFGAIHRIYDLAALCTIPKYEAHEYYDVNVSGAISITDFARRHSVQDIVFVSSMATYGAGERQLPETAEQTPDNAYGWSKLIAERVYDAWRLEDNERKLIICRPAVIFGKGENGNFTRLARLLRYGLFVYPGRRSTIKACYYVKHLVADLLQLESSNRSKILIFNACYDTKYTIESIVQTFEKSMNRRVFAITVPNWLLILMSKILQIGDILGLGVHPDRVRKLSTSTDLEPAFLRGQGFARGNCLFAALEDWKSESNGEWV